REMRQMMMNETEGWGGARLTPRDVEALRWLVEQRAGSLEQVGRLLHQLGGEVLTDRRVRQVVSRWEQMGVASKWHVWHAESAVVLPTGQAARMFGFTRWRRPGIGILRHTIAVSEIRLRVAPIGGARTWTSETDLRRLLPSHEHLPDGAWTDANGSVAIEVELTPHGRKRVETTIKTLLNAHDGTGLRWATVLYLCSPATHSQVSGVRDELPPNDRNRVIVRAMP
ncbi:MAG: hypothetical protein RLZZ43_1341, partial [Actinomycetota bacterium]